MDFKRLESWSPSEKYDPEYRYYYPFQTLFIFASWFDQNDSKNKNDAFQYCIEAVCSLIQKEMKTIDLSTTKIKSFTTSNLKRYVELLFKKVQTLNNSYPSLQMKLSMYKGKHILAKETWAHPCWFTIHFLSTCVSNGKFDDDLQNFNIFINTLQDLLPCRRCKEHLSENIVSSEVLYNDKNGKKFMIGFPYNNFTSPIEVFIWTIMFHSFVNSNISGRTEEFDNYPAKLKMYIDMYHMR